MIQTLISVETSPLFSFVRNKEKKYIPTDRPYFLFNNQTWFFNEEVHEWFVDLELYYTLSYRQPESPFENPKVYLYTTCTEHLLLFMLTWKI